MTKTIELLLPLLLLACTQLLAQNNIGIGTTKPDPSAALHIKSDTQGLLIPRMDSKSRMAILKPANGLLVYDTDKNAFWYYNNAWKPLTADLTNQENVLIQSANTSIDLTENTDRLYDNFNGEHMVVQMGTLAPSYAEIAVGSFNTEYTPEDTDGVNDADRAFSVGNGTDAEHRSDALIVYKSGNAVLNGALTIDSAFTLPTTDGTAGQVLTTDGAGHLSWKNVGTLNAQSTAGATNNITSDDWLVGADSMNYGGTGTERKAFFDQSEAAFRAGAVSTENWNTGDLGFSSFATGTDTKASGGGSVATGFSTVASGIGSVALGENTTANGQAAVAAGAHTAASGDMAVALGDYSTASGQNATAFGDHTTASGQNALAHGEYSTAGGQTAVAFGDHTAAPSYAEVSIGSYSTEYTPNSTSFVHASDRAFTIGNGSGSSSRSDAFVVYKSGAVVLNGALNIDSAYTFPITDGTNGQVLTTDGTGNISWGDASSGAFSSVNGVTLANNTSDDFLVGADSMNYGGSGISIENKMFYNSEKGAFRVGTVVGQYWDTDSLGTFSFATGANTKATAIGSTALGTSTTASGNGSSAIGVVITAPSYAETAIGSYNTEYTAKSTSSFNSSDRLFTIGNGSASSNRSDALIVYKSGDAVLNGALNIDSAYTFPTADGTDGQILTTDGAGNVSWADKTFEVTTDTFYSNGFGYTFQNYELSPDSSDFDADIVNYGYSTPKLTLNGDSSKWAIYENRLGFTIGSAEDTNVIPSNEYFQMQPSSLYYVSEDRSGIKFTSYDNDRVDLELLGANGIINTDARIIFGSETGSPELRGNDFFFNTNVGLNVGGSLMVDSAYTFPAADGTNGQVLTTDGAGNVSWGDAGSTNTDDQTLSLTDNTLSISGNSGSNVDLSQLDSLGGDTKINGALTLNEAFTFPTADGTDGQVLTTDGTGNVSWGENGESYLTRYTFDTSSVYYEYYGLGSDTKVDNLWNATLNDSLPYIGGLTLGSSLDSSDFILFETPSVSMFGLDPSFNISKNPFKYDDSDFNFQLQKNQLQFTTEGGGNFSLKENQLQFATEGGGNFSYTHQSDYWQIMAFSSNMSTTATVKTSFWFGNGGSRPELNVSGVSGFEFSGSAGISVNGININGNNSTMFLDGALTIDSAYTLPTTDGTNGQVLATDGNGNVSWGDAGSTNTDDQTLSLTDNTLSISGNSGSNVDLSQLDSLGGDTKINGALTLNEAFTLPTADGTDGQVLTTDGTGNVSWANASGGAFSSTNGVTLANNTSDDFLVGADSMNYSGSGIEVKMFFDKNTGAFRAGATADQSWDSDSLGWGSFAAGIDNKASGFGTNALGLSNKASGNYTTVAGLSNTASGDYATAFGSNDTASGDYSLTIGRNNKAIYPFAMAFGDNTSANGYYATTFGDRTTASGNYATTFGLSSTADGFFSLSFGQNTNANGNYSTAFGYYSNANGDYSAAFGNSSVAGSSAAAFGSHTTAESYAAAFGSYTTAGSYAAAFGDSTSASGIGSATFGTHTTAPSYTEMTIGSYNTTYDPNSNFDVNLADRAFTIGNGTGTSNRSDALIVYKSGDAVLNGALNIDSAYTLPTADGTNGQVLSTDGNGNVSWGDAGEINTDDQTLSLTNNTLSISGASGSNVDLSQLDSLGGDTKINGALTLNEAFTFPTVDGTNGQVLTTDGAGVISWADASSGAFSSVDGVTLANNTSDDFLVGTDSLNYGGMNFENENKVFFDQDKAAFRAGYVESKRWDKDSLGIGSAAFGRNAKASGYNAFAAGDNTTASGTSSTAFGDKTVASGTRSVAFGDESIANSTNATAFGRETSAISSYATAFGFQSTASGFISTAFGYQDTAAGSFSTAFGYKTSASGSRATALGSGTTAPSYMETALGSYNTSYVPMGTGSYDTGDRLFVIGNGTDATNRSDALIVYKSGDLVLNGSLNIDSAYTLPTTDGNIGQVLTTNGVGTISWADAGGANTDDQTLSLTNNTLNISGNSGSNVDLSQLDSLGGNTKINGKLTVQDTIALGGVDSDKALEPLFVATETDGLEIPVMAYNKTGVQGDVGTGYGFGVGSVDPLMKAAIVFERQTSWGRGDLHILLNNEANANDLDFDDAIVTFTQTGNTEINGALTISNAYTLPTSDGTNGQILSTDGSGNVSWQENSGAFVSDNGVTASVNSSDDFVFGSDALDYGGSGNESKILFDESKGAFRVGTVSNQNWDADSLGQNSFAAGYNSKAIGDYATAFGSNATASDEGTNAFGVNTTASGDYAVAFGHSTIASGEFGLAFGLSTEAFGNYTAAFGQNSEAIGDYATAFGKGSDAVGDYTTTFGLSSEAIGDYATAFGRHTEATGSYATVFGNLSEANGDYATAFGAYTFARSYAEVVVGAFNTDYTPTATTSFNSADRLFTIGNGTSDNDRSDALVIYKSGDVEFNGDASVAGDIELDGDANIAGNLELNSNANIEGNLELNGNANIEGNLELNGDANVAGDIELDGNLDTDGSIVLSGETIKGGFTTTSTNSTNLLLEMSANAISGNTVQNEQGGVFRIDTRGGSYDLFQWYTKPIGNTGITTSDLVMEVSKAGDLIIQGGAKKNTAGDWLANSDARLKKEITPLNSQATLDKLLKLQGVTYQWDDDKTGTKRPEGVQYGFTAQNVQRVFPELVSEDKQGYLITAYGTYDAMYIEAFRAQQNQIEELQAKELQQKAEIESLKAALDQQKTDAAQQKTAFELERTSLSARMTKIEALLNEKPVASK